METGQLGGRRGEGWYDVRMVRVAEADKPCWTSKVAEKNCLDHGANGRICVPWR